MARGEEDGGSAVSINVCLHEAQNVFVHFYLAMQKAQEWHDGGRQRKRTRRRS